MPEPNVNAPKAQTPSTPATPDTKWAVASLVCGILGVVTMYFGVIFGILAIVFAHKQKKIQPNGMATAGFVLGIIGIVIGLFLGVLMVIGAMAYFGALNPDSFGERNPDDTINQEDYLPDRCFMNPPFICTEFSAQGNALAFTIQNAAGVDLEGITMTASGCTSDAFVGTLMNGESKTVAFTCGLQDDNGLLKSNISVAYTKEGLLHTAHGGVFIHVN